MDSRRGKGISGRFPRLNFARYHFGDPGLEIIMHNFIKDNFVSCYYFTEFCLILKRPTFMVTSVGASLNYSGTKDQ